MEIIQMRPRDAVIASLIESYYLISNMQPTQVTTLPNGRVDATIILEGKIEWYYSKQKKFRPLPVFCFYPLTNRVNWAASKSILKCVSIKFYPHVLTLSIFKGKNFEEPRPFSYFFNSAVLNGKFLRDLQKTESREERITLLDKYFMSVLFPKETTGQWMEKVTNLIENSREKARILTIANSMGISIKTLERKFIHTIGLTPKEYLKIMQLQKTIQSFKKADGPFAHGDLTRLLGEEYYDQAHFVKSCRKITGMTPKQLFVKLPGGMSDIVLQQNLL